MLWDTAGLLANDNYSTPTVNNIYCLLSSRIYCLLSSRTGSGIQW